MSDRARKDREALDRVIATVQRLVPAATAFDLDTSDQGFYGFVLCDVHLDDGSTLPAGDPIWEGLYDAVVEDLWDLDWDGVVGEDKHGNATIEPDPRGSARQRHLFTILADAVQVCTTTQDRLIVDGYRLDDRPYKEAYANLYDERTGEMFGVDIRTVATGVEKLGGADAGPVAILHAALGLNTGAKT